MGTLIKPILLYFHKIPWDKYIGSAQWGINIIKKVAFGETKIDKIDNMPLVVVNDNTQGDNTQGGSQLREVSVIRSVLEECKNNTTNSIDGSRLLNLLYSELPPAKSPYIVINTDENLDGSIVGEAIPGRFAIISIYHFKNYRDPNQPNLPQYIYLAQVLHEFGHVCGAACGRYRGKKNVIDLGGSHCTDPECVMSQGPIVPYDWIKKGKKISDIMKLMYRLLLSETPGGILEDVRNIDTKVYCELCREDIRNFFKTNDLNEYFGIGKIKTN